MRSAPRCPAFCGLPGLALVGLFFAGCSGAPSRIAPGWRARLDVPDAGIEKVMLRETDAGLLAKTGPNVIFWSDAAPVTPPYRLTVQVHNLDSHGHPHGVGLLFGGADLDLPTQRYTYFLVRGDGSFLVKRRDGAETSELQGWKRHPAIVPEDSIGLAQNLLTVDVGVERVVFAVNGVDVFEAPRSALHDEGRFGLRMVHDLTILFSGLRSEGTTR